MQNRRTQLESAAAEFGCSSERKITGCAPAVVKSTCVLFSLPGGKDHTLDMAFHLPGKWSNLPAGEPWKSNEKIGYPFIEPATIRQSKPLEPVTLNVSNHGRAVALTLLGGGMPTDIITGAGVGESTEARVPVAIFRRTGGSATYIWSISLDGSKPAIDVLPSPPGTTAIQIGGVQLTVNPAERSVMVHEGKE